MPLIAHLEPPSCSSEAAAHNPNPSTAHRAPTWSSLFAASVSATVPLTAAEQQAAGGLPSGPTRLGRTGGWPRDFVSLVDALAGRKAAMRTANSSSWGCLLRVMARPRVRMWALREIG